MTGSTRHRHACAGTAGMDSHVDGRRTHASVLRCSKYLVTQSLHLLIGNCHRTLECHSHSSVEHQPNMPCTVYNQDPKRARNITTGHPWPCILAMQSHTQAAHCPLQGGHVAPSPGGQQGVHHTCSHQVAQHLVKKLALGQICKLGHLL